MSLCCLLSRYFPLSRKFCKCMKASRSNGKGCSRQWLRPVHEPLGYALGRKDARSPTYLQALFRDLSP